MPDGQLVRSSALARGRPIPAVKTANPLRETDIPAAALSQMKSGLASASAGANARALEEEPRREQASMAPMSRNGKLVVASRSGHHIQLDEPDLVVRIVQQVLATGR